MNEQEFDEKVNAARNAAFEAGFYAAVAYIERTGGHSAGAALRLNPHVVLTPLWGWWNQGWLAAIV